MSIVKMPRGRQTLGKYRIEKRIAVGPRATVFQAYDTIHGTRVALKIADPAVVSETFLEDFRREAKLSVKMEHPNVLPIQNACFLDGLFVIAMPLGDETLADRMTRRMSTRLALDFTGQALAAVAHAHDRKIIHCDIKPDNFIVFPDNRLKLTDFGFSKVMVRQGQKGSGSGTVGYLAPEQALGRPMFQSDVFALSLMIYELFSGTLPEWPYKWPPPGYPRIRAKLRPAMLRWLRKGMEFKPQARYGNAVVMERAFNEIPRKLAVRRG